MAALAALRLGTAAEAGAEPIDLTTPDNGIVTSCPSHANYGGAKAFDDGSVTDEKSRWLVIKSSETLTNAWVQFEFKDGLGRIVNAYRVWGLTSYEYAKRDPRDFNLQGSNDGENWTLLDSRAGQTGWANAEPRYFEFSNLTPYSRYKFTITANNGATDTYHTGLGELELFSTQADLDMAHPVTGSTLFTNTNVVDVLFLAIPADCSHYQTSFSTDAAALDPAGWIPANVPLEQITFPMPSADTNLEARVWFTNFNTAAALSHSDGRIRYTAAQPVARVAPPQTRSLAEGYTTVTVTVDDVDAASDGGTAQGMPLAIFERRIANAADTTPAAAEVTLATAGAHEVILTVVNEAGNSASATATVTLVEGELRIWTGTGGNALSSNAGNWLPATVPVDGNSVLFDGTSLTNCIWDLDVVLSSWTQTAACTGTVTFATVYPGQGGFTNLLIGRDATVMGGVWTHPANSGGAVEVERLSLTVGGNFTLGPAAMVGLDGKGYAAASGPGAGSSGWAGYSASHGGAGAHNPSGSGTYGSVTRPESLGSGAQGRGGGALRMAVGGTAIVEGVISAQGVNSASSNIGFYNHGAGGSILIEAGTFAGNGTVRAGIDTSKAAYYGSGGGRIALISGSETGFGGLAPAANTHTQIRDGGGRAGTVYLETPVSKRLIVDQGNIGTDSGNHTDLPARLASDEPHPAHGGELEDVALVATNGAFVGLPRDLRIGSFSLLDGTLALNSWTLYVKEPEPASFPVDFGNGGIIYPGVCHTFDNGDTLTRDGRILWGDAPVTWRATSVVYGDTGGTTAINDDISEGYFAHGSLLTFNAYTNAGYLFMHWDGSVPVGTSSPDNPLALPALAGNVALRAWFRDESLETSTNIWAATPSNDDWFDPLNWSRFAPPAAGQTVILPTGAAVRLTASPPSLEHFEIADSATLTFAGWETALDAEKIVVAGTVTHDGQTVTGPDPVTGDWVPQHRIWLKGSNLIVTAAGKLDADYKGYPPSAGAGAPTLAGGYDGSGGGGYGGNGGDGFGGAPAGPAHGEAADPWQPGSGCKKYLTSSNGSGGGAIRIEMSGQVIIDGLVSAQGQPGNSTHRPGGSGGGIAIYCKTFEGGASGLVRADGGRGDYYGGNGGGGRIAVHYDPAAQAALTNPRSPVRFSTYAWPTSISGTTRYEFTIRARMGTLYLPDLTLLAASPTAPAVLDGHRFWHTRLCIGDEFNTWTPQSLVISNCAIGLPEGFALETAADLTLAGTMPPLVGETWERAGLTLHAVATNELYGARLAVGRDLVIGSDSWIYPHTEGYSAAVVGMRVGRNVVIAAGGGIDANEKGYMPQPGNLNGPGAGLDADSGGAYGGAGGGAKQAQPYGLAALPLQPGSPGGWRKWSNTTQSGRGGGAIHLLAGGDIHLDGLLTANGGRGWFYCGPGGSGGAIFVAGRRVTGSGEIRANGGAGEGARGPGGGGRIAVWHHVPMANAAQRIAERDISGLAYSPSSPAFNGVMHVDVTPSTLTHQPGQGTAGFYAMAATLVILR